MKPNIIQNTGFSTLSEKDKVDFYISMAVVILAGLFILYFTFPTFFETTGSTSNNILIDNTLDVDQVKIEDHVYIPVTEDALNREEITQVEKIRTISHPEYIASTSSKKIAHTIEKNQTHKTVNQPIISTQKNNDAVIIDTTSVIKDDISPKSKEKSDVTIEKLSTTSSQYDIDNNKLSDSGNSCIVVVGAYGKQRSINKLVTRLEKDGYDIFKTPYKGLTRIGVYLPCNKANIENELINIRKKYAKDAMVLRKN